MIIQTENQLHRTLQALAETGALIQKEMRYSPDLQKKDYLASLENHAAKLNRMIDDYKASK